jgi:hypothetical protein
MDASDPLPPPDRILARIDTCRAELKALQRLLKASQAAARAEQARRQHTVRQAEGQEVRRV